MEYGAANGRRTQPERALPRALGLYGVLSLAFGLASPFLALFLATRGLSAAAIGVALSAGTAIRIVSGPAGGRVADRLRAPRAVLTACTAGAALIGWLYLPVHSSAALIGVSILHAAALAPIVPLADPLAIASAAADHFAYGWVRGAGSAAFIIGTIAAGLVVATHGIASIIWLNIALLAVSAWC